MSTVLSIVAGIIGGACYAVVGYFGSNESFDKFKFLRTFIISVIEGGFVGLYLGDPKLAALATFTGVVTTEEIGKGIAKRLGAGRSS